MSKLALEWMLQEAKAAGLLVDPARAKRVLGRTGTGYVPPDPKACMHKSLKGLWYIVEVIPKKEYDPASGALKWCVNFGRRRKLPSRALVHESAYERDPEYRKKLPKNPYE